MAKYPISRQKIRVKGKTNQDEEYDPSFEIEVEDTYEAKEKNIPSGLPREFNGQPVTWINNFVVKSKGATESGEEKKGKVRSYKVFLRKLPEASSGPRGICVYYEGGLHRMTLEQDPNRTDWVMFTLDVGDPPSGLYP